MTTEEGSQTSGKPKIGIALSGGGTRGMVHVGVLQALEEHGIIPEVVSGTSAGSIVGAFYAHGYSPAEIRNIAGSQSLTRLLSLRIPSTGFIRHTLLRKVMEKHLPVNSFEKCAKDFHVAVSNLNTGKVEVYNEGPLFDYVIASSSVPILFEPLEIDGSKYVDGGVLMNLPASPIADKCDLLIGVNLVPLLEVPGDQIKSVISVGTRCFDLAAINNIKPELQYCDVVISPDDINDFSRFNVRQMNAMYEIGYQEGMEAIEEIKSLMQKATSSAN